MSNKNFLLLSLEDDKIKKVSNVISNESCRKILDYLSDKEATESELAGNLQIPISTVHYNLLQLMETGLISADEFHYSKKGKEMSHYRLANKYIVITPKKTYGIREKLKGILPAALIAAATAGAIQSFSYYFLRGTFALAPESNGALPEMMQQSLAAAPALGDTAQKAAAKTAYLAPQNIALWFLAGALFALAVYFALNSVRKKSKT